MKRIYYNKLVRDKIPDIIESSGAEMEIRKLNKQEYRKELLKKISEEVNEVIKAQDKKKLTSELADVIEVINEIKKEFNLSEEEIKKALKKNFDKKGGFEKKIFLLWTSDNGYKSN